MKKLMSSMKEMKSEEDLDAGDAVVDVKAEERPRYQLLERSCTQLFSWFPLQEI